MDMRPKGPAPTIGGLAKDCEAALVDCLDCRRQARITLAALAVKLGYDTPFPVAAARLKCSGCGSKRVHARPDWKFG